MKKLILIPLLLFSLILSGATYYVAPSGGSDGNAGTNIAAPWATWQKAFTTATAGDTVYFRAGVWYPTAQVYKASGNGTRTNPICFFNYPGEVPILDGINKTSESHGIYLTGVDNIHLKGLTIRNNRQITGEQVQGFLIANCTNITFTNCTSHNNGYRGFNLFQTDTAYFYNCDSYRNSDTLSSGPGNGGDGFNFWGYDGNTASYVIVRGCRAWENSDDGFDTNYDGYVEYDSCWSFNNGNLLSASEGQGFKLGLKENDAAFLTRRVSNCIMAFNANTGLTTNEDPNDASFVAQSMQIYNNTSYHNGYHSNHTTWGWGYSIVNSAASSDEIELSRIFRNNIAYDNAQNPVLLWPDALYTHSSNTWDIPLTITDADFVSVDSTGITAARQANGSLPNNDCYNYFLRLSSTSDCIDAGTDVGLDYTGIAPDLGWAEYAEQDPPEEPILATLSTYDPYWTSTTTASTGGFVSDDGGGTVSVRGVCWNTTGTPDTGDSKTEDGTGDGAFTSTMTGLTQGTTYYVRAYATNEAGTAYGTQMTFRAQIIKHDNKFIKHGGKFIIIN
jgi:hypothetical protein